MTLILGFGDKSQVESPSEGSRDWYRDSADANRRGPALLGAGAVLLPVGVLLTAAGTVWTLKVRRGRDEPSAVSMSVGLGSFSLRGSF